MSRVLTAKRRALENRRVRQARNVRELARLVRALTRSPLFDRDLYEQQRGRRFPSRSAAAYDYVVSGSRSGLVAGPLLLPPVPAGARPPGTGPAAAWASSVRQQGFPTTTALPSVDLHRYAEQHPEARTAEGGPLAHYASVGRLRGYAAGPRHTDGSDLVEVGRRAVLGSAVPVSIVAAGAGAGGSDDDGPARVSVLVVGSDPVQTALGVIDAVLDPVCAVDEVVVAVPGATTPESRLVAASLSTVSSKVRFAEAATDVAAALDSAATAASGQVLLVVTERVATTAADMAALLGAAGPGRASVLTPVVLAPDGTVQAAGLRREASELVPVLQGYPLADAERAGSTAVEAISGEVAVVTRDALALGGGPAAEPTGHPSAAAVVSALSERVASAGGDVRAIGSASVDLPPAPGAPHRRLAHHEPPVPAAYADTAVPPVLRWAIKSPHPAGPRRRAWGDYYFARALAASLTALGHEVAVDPLDSWYRATAAEDHVTLTLRGISRYRPAPHQVNLCWIISHPELVDDEELAGFDAVFAASISWSRRRTAEGSAVRALLQCTDGASFTPDAAEPGTGYPLLFVGNSRSARRPIVEAALATGRDLAVVGGGWAGRLPASVLRGDHVSNDALPALYRSAGVVLNDHWPDMAADGFLSNRLFDLTAAGARWVSDPATDLAEVFPQGRVAATAAELEQLLRGAPDSFPTEAELQEASALVRREHTFDRRAETLSQAAVELVAQRHGAGHARGA